MRIRTIKPAFWTHEVMSTMPAETALLALALLNYADDEGYFNANPRLIQAALFPLRELSATIPGMIAELARIGWLEVHESASGRSIGKICNFLRHQRVSKPQKSQLKLDFNSSNNSKSKASDSLPDDSGNGFGTVDEGSATPPGGNGNKEEGEEREEGEEKETPKAPKGAGDQVKRSRKRKAGSAHPSEQIEPTRTRMLEINGLTRRLPSTRWSGDEVEAFRDAGLDGLSGDDFTAQFEPLKAYYGASIPREMDFRRTDTLRLLRNWSGELDRARRWVRDNNDGLKRM